MKHPLLCPHCLHLLLHPNEHILAGICPTCGWRGLPQYPAILPNSPSKPQKGFLRGGLGCIWLVSTGQLLAFSPAHDTWQSLPLPASWVLNGLTFAAGVALLSPGEENTLGEPKPFIGLAPETGLVLWQAKGEGIQWTAPVSDETLACAVDSRGQVLAVHPRTGKPCWKHPVSLDNFPRLGIPPILSDSYLLLTTPMGELLWLSRHNGTEAGRYLPSTGGLDFPPACTNDVAYLCAGEGLYRLDLHTGQGQELFRAPRKAGPGCYFAEPVATPQGLLVLHADFSEGGQPAYAMQLLDVSTAEPRWKYFLHHHPRFAPLSHDNHVYLPDRDGHLLILDLKDGKKLASLPLGEEKPVSSVLLLDSRIYLLTESGQLLCFDSDLRSEHLPETPQTYLQRGDWESASLAHALHDNLNFAGELYKAHGHIPEALALFGLAGNQKEEIVPTLNRKLRVFLCHSSLDKPTVRDLYQRLNAESWIDPWLDEEKLLPGQDWNLEIEKAVEFADTVIVCLSNTSVTKEGYVQKEIKKALDKADEKPEGMIFIIPLRFDECQVPRRLNRWQYLDYSGERDERAYGRLLESLRIRANLVNE